MDIVDLIKKFDTEDNEKTINDMLAVFRDNYKSYLKNIDKVTSNRKVAMSLSIISRKKDVATYMSKDNNINYIIEKLLLDDNKVRKNTYSMMYNIDTPIEKFYDLLDKEDNYINIVHLIEIISKFDSVDVDRIQRKVKSMNKCDVNFAKAKNLLEKLKIMAEDKLCMSILNVSDSILLTASGIAKRVLCEDLKDNNIKELESIESGIIVSGKYALDDILKVRSFDELLIAPHRTYKTDMAGIASLISGILDIKYFNTLFKSKRNKFSYRLEIKGVDNKERIKMSNDILCNIKNGSFINIRDNYDFEIRVYISKGNAKVFIKVPYNDIRFVYRKRELPASISPVTASVITKIIEPYIGDAKNVLDGFVGTGTMLYEYYMRYGNANYTGVDIESNAINFAKTNIGNIPSLTLIKSDITKVKLKRKADIILSNMPFGTRVLRHDSIITLYEEFAKKLDTLLSDKGKAFLLTTNGKAIRESLSHNGYRVLKEFRVESGGLLPYLLVVEKN